MTANPSLPTNPLDSTLQAELGSLTTDDQWLTALGLPDTESAPPPPSNPERTYIASVSPHFFTHYGGGLDKNFVYVTDDHAFARRWANLIGARDHIDIVEVRLSVYFCFYCRGPGPGLWPLVVNWLTADSVGIDHFLE